MLHVCKGATIRQFLNQAKLSVVFGVHFKVVHILGNAAVAEAAQCLYLPFEKLKLFPTGNLIENQFLDSNSPPITTACSISCAA